MNPYGVKAQKHWRRWLPKRYSELEDPDSFFSNLGDEIATRVNELSRALEGQDPPGEEFMQKVGRLNMARHVAEGQALRELALIEPEEEEEEENQNQD